MEELLKIDEALFLYLNGIGQPTWDGFWLYLSRSISVITIPIYIFVIFLSYRIFGFKKAIFILLMTILLIGSTEQLSIFVKNTVQRLRPCYHAEIHELMRHVKDYCGGRFGYFSAHAANSWAFTSFFGLLLINRTKFLVFSMVIWALLVSYSRIYIGVHFPLDVITGMVVGILFGGLFVRIFWRMGKLF